MAAKASLTMVSLSAVVTVVVFAACSSPASASPLGRRYRVGGPEGWHIPPPQEKEMYYVKWASPIAFYVEDSIEFVYKNDSVIKVSKTGYYHCNETAGIGTGVAPRDGSTLFLLDAPGFAYFACADHDHCMKGERLMINVLAPQPPALASSNSPAKAPRAAPRAAPSTKKSPSSAPAPGPAMEFESGAGESLVASLARALVPAALALAGLV